MIWLHLIEDRIKVESHLDYQTQVQMHLLFLHHQLGEFSLEVQSQSKSQYCYRTCQRIKMIHLMMMESMKKLNLTNRELNLYNHSLNKRDARYRLS